MFKHVITLASLLALLTLIGNVAPAQEDDEGAVSDAPENVAADQPEPEVQVTVPPGMMVLKPELPKAMFVGTPKNLSSPNLEPPKTAHPPLIVPKDVTNVALKKPVTGSDNEPIIGGMDYVTDGDKAGADGSYVELGPGLQWIQIDLGSEQAIYAIVAWHFHSEGRVYRDVVVRVANDPDFITGVTTVFNNDHDNSAGLGVGKDKEYVETFKGRVIDCKGVKGRYVRLYSKGNTSNDQNHYIEVEVYGKPAK